MQIGFVNINKPKGISSHKVVSKLRSYLGIKRIGHSGTLDPIATGVLVCAIGKTTRLLNYIEHDKEYRIKIRLGIQTDTYDISGKVLYELKESPNITEEMVKDVLKDFEGNIVQIVPPYSAVHIAGERAYKLARKNYTMPQIKKNTIIKSIKLIEFSYPYLTLDVWCSRGTYMRSLSHELGLKLGTGSVLSEVVRLRVGAFKISDAIPLDKLSTYQPHEIIIGLDFGLSHLPVLKLPERFACLVRHGNFILYPTKIKGFLRMYDNFDNFIGIGNCEDMRIIKPVCIIA